MKDEVLPEIPQQNAAQFQSMYEQLRKTSKKISGNTVRKMIFDNNYHSKNSNDSYKKQPSFHSIPLNVEGDQHVKESKQRRELLIFMREQIEISCQLYNSKIKLLLNEQSKKIKYLSDLLIKNQVQLNSKDKIIQQLIKQNVDSHHDFQLISTSFHVKINDIENKYVKVQQKSIRLKQSFQKQLQSIKSYYCRTFQQIQKRLDIKMQDLQQYSQIFKHQSKSKQLSFSSIGKDINTMQNEIEDLKVQIKSFKNKQYCYQNYKIDDLCQKITSLHAILQNQEKQIKHYKKNSLSPIFKDSQTLHIGKTDQLINKSSPKIRFLEKYKSMINTKKPRSKNIKELHNIQKESDESESQVQQVMIYKEGNIERLIKIMQKSKMKKPLKLQIDQTGYAKSCDTGMYLVDNVGDGFEFDQSQIQYLTKNKIIQL